MENPLKVFKQTDTSMLNLHLIRISMRQEFNVPLGLSVLLDWWYLLVLLDDWLCEFLRQRLIVLTSTSKITLKLLLELVRQLSCVDRRCWHHLLQVLLLLFWEMNLISNDNFEIIGGMILGPRLDSHINFRVLLFLDIWAAHSSKGRCPYTFIELLDDLSLVVDEHAWTGSLHGPRLSS